MSVFQFVRAQLGENLLDRICKRHCDNKQTFFDLLQSMTGVKIDSQMTNTNCYVIEGTWEALERCHTVLYKYQAELCAEELADLADQQQQQQHQGYPLLTPPNSSGNSSSSSGSIITSTINHQLKKPSPDSSTSSCAPLEPITPNSAFNTLSDASNSSPIISALPLIPSLYDRSSVSPVASRGLDLSLKSMTHPLGLFGSPVAGHTTPPVVNSAAAIQTAALNLATVGCLPLVGQANSLLNGALSNVGGGSHHQIEGSIEDDNDNGSMDGCSDYSHDSPVDIESTTTTTTSKSAIDCLMDMKVEPGSIKIPADSQFLANSPQSDALSINSDILSQSGNNPTSSSSTNPVSSSTSTTRQRKPNSASRNNRPGTAIGAVAAGIVSNAAGFMPNKTDQTKVHPCPFCPVTLGSSMNLKKHIQRKHSTPLHKCDICGKAYGFVNDLREHKKIHFLNLPCNQCDKVFKSRRSLLGHLSIAHKDSGVPPPPPPPTGPFTELSPASAASTANNNDCNTTRNNTTTTPTLTNNDLVNKTTQQQLNLSLYSSLSAINSYFSGAGLDSDIINASSSPDKQSPNTFSNNSVAQNLLSEFDKRLGMISNSPNSLSSLSANNNLINRTIGSSVVQTTASTFTTGDILNLTKSDLSDTPLKSPIKEDSTSSPKTVASSVPMEVSVQ